MLDDTCCAKMGCVRTQARQRGVVVPIYTRSFAVHGQVGFGRTDVRTLDPPTKYTGFGTKVSGYIDTCAAMWLGTGDASNCLHQYIVRIQTAAFRSTSRHLLIVVVLACRDDWAPH